MDTLHTAQVSPVPAILILNPYYPHNIYAIKPVKIVNLIFKFECWLKIVRLKTRQQYIKPYKIDKK